MIVFNIKSWQGGQSDFDDKGITGSGKFISGAEIRGSSDGLKAKQALKQEGTGVFEDLVLWFVPAPDDCTYAFGDNGRVYKRTSAGVWTKVYTDAGGKILGAAIGYRYVSTNVYQPYIFWATDTTLHRKEIPGETDWSDVDEAGSGTGETYPKTNLTSATWHPMKWATGYLMIGNLNLVAFVAYDGSYTTEGLQTIPGLEITAITDRINEIAVMASSTTGDNTANLYSWDTIQTSWLSRTPMNFKTVSAAIDGEFFLMAAEGQGWYTDLYTKLPVFDFPGGGTIKPGGVAIRENVALFAVGDAVRESAGENITCNGIYGYGRKRNSGTPVLNLEYPIICSEMGGLMNNGDLLLVACKVVTTVDEVTTTTYKVMTIDDDNKQIVTYESLELKPPYLPPEERYQIARIILKTKTMPTGTKIECYYRLDLDGAWVQAEFLSTMELQGTTGSDVEFTTGNEASFLVGSYANFIEVKLVLTPNGNDSPEVKDIYIEVKDEKEDE